MGRLSEIERLCANGGGGAEDGSEDSDCDDGSQHQRTSYDTRGSDMGGVWGAGGGGNHSSLRDPRGSGGGASVTFSEGGGGFRPAGDGGGGRGGGHPGESKSDSVRVCRSLRDAVYLSMVGLCRSVSCVSVHLSLDS